jgi:hypothetical protein
VGKLAAHFSVQVIGTLKAAELAVPDKLVTGVDHVLAGAASSELR